MKIDDGTGNYVDPDATYYDPNTGLAFTANATTYTNEPTTNTNTGAGVGGTYSDPNYPSIGGWQSYGDVDYATGYSTTTSEPWSEQISYLKNLFSEAQNLYNKTMSLYPEGWTASDVVASFTPEQQTSQGMVSSRALQGSSLLSSGQNMLENTLSGSYLSPDTNPYLNYYVDQAIKSVMPKLDNSAIQAGRYGSNAWSDMKSDVASKVANEIYGGAYKDERQNMIDALKYGIGYSREDYFDPAMLSAVGEEKQSYDQSLIDAALKEYQWNQYADWWKLGAYKDLISGDYGGTSGSKYPITSTTSSSESSYGDTSWLSDLLSSYLSGSSDSSSDSSSGSSSSSSDSGDSWWGNTLEDFGWNF